MRNIIHISVAFAFLITHTLSISAQPQQANPSQEQYIPTWNVTVLGVLSDDFSAMSQIVQQTSLFINSLLDTTIKAIPTHTMMPEENIKAKELLRSDAILALQEKLETEMTNLDVLTLETNKKDAWTTRVKKQKDIKKIEKDIKILKNLTVADIPMGKTISVVLKQQSKYTSILPTADLQNIAEELKVQSMMFFTLNELQDSYVIVTLYEYNAITKEKNNVIKTVVNKENIESITNVLNKSVISHILGHPASSLRVEVAINSDEEIWKHRALDANIFIDGTLAGSGDADISVIQSGSHDIQVVFEDETRNILVELQPGDRLVRRILFDINPENTITILSKPTHARVYVNSEWMGNTPLVLSRPTGSNADQIEIQYEDHETVRKTLTTLSPANISVDLQTKYAVPLETRFDQDRNKFYTAFAIFGGSLILPIVLNGLYASENASITVAQNAVGVSSNALEEATFRRDAYFYSYLGSLSLATGAGIYAIMELFQYLNTASEYHER